MDSPEVRDLHDEGDASNPQLPAVLRWCAAGVVALLGVAALAALVVTIVTIVRLSG